MKRKRLDRDLWLFDKFPYYQTRVDIDIFHGLASMIQIADGQYSFWEFPIAGKVAVCGTGMTWLQLVPDGRKQVLTAKYLPHKKTIHGVEYTDTLSVCYVDIIEGIEYDADGVAVFLDMYVDVIFTLQGDVKIDDLNELGTALQSGDITNYQYISALEECNAVIEEYCSNFEKSELFFYEVLSHVNDRIKNDEKFVGLSCQKDDLK